MVMMTDQAEANQKAITLTSQRTGLHWTATEVIAAETPILDEKPFVHESQDLDTCDCCRLNLDGQIIPCLHCNQVIYCHRDCASLHQTDWHSVACGGLLQVVRKIGPVAVLLFQMIAKAGGPRLAMELYESRRDYQVEQYLNSEDCQKGI